MLWEQRPYLSTGSSPATGVHGEPRMSDILKSPFPYFGGKSRVADLIWERFGDVSNFIEPFFGSGAVLLRRPHPPRIETVNDVNHHICNFWRAIRHDPEAVAKHADWPVNEIDMHAIHRWLVLGEEAAEFARRVREDPDYFDARRAGRWCWGACCWIGSGWCSADELRNDGFPREKLPKPSRDCGGVHLPIQVLGMIGGMDARGVNSLPDKRPLLAGPANEHGERSHYGLGVHAKGRNPAIWAQKPQLAMWNDQHVHRPQLADAYSRGRGVNGNDSAGTCEARRAWLLDWFGRLADRLRAVRVCCGDWRRVCDSDSVTTRLGITGLFLDPPYSKTRDDGTANRQADLYSNDNCQDVDALVRDVRAYCLERGTDPRMRLALCGYEGEGHEVLEQHGWNVVAWKASGGYGNRSENGKKNAGRERIWFSPHCVKPDDDMPLFGALQ